MLGIDIIINVVHLLISPLLEDQTPWSNSIWLPKYLSVDKYVSVPYFQIELIINIVIQGKTKCRSYTECICYSKYLITLKYSLSSIKQNFEVPSGLS